MSNQPSEQQPTETSMILTPRQQHLQRVRDEMAPGAMPAAIVPHTFAEVMTMCTALAAANLAPKNLRGNATDMALVIMTGAEVGLPPMASLRLYTTWDGVPRLMAEGVRAIILQSPAIEYFEMVACDDNQATWIGKRRGRPEKSVTWTLERAKKAGLLNKENWMKYAQDMLNARASMQLGRILAPDVVAGMVALEEARDGDFLDAQSIDARPVFVAPPPPQGHRIGETSHAMAHPQAPPPGVPDVGQTIVAHSPPALRAMASAVSGVTVTDTGTRPTAPAKPPKPPKAQPSQTPGTDPFRAAREAVDARETERPTTPASAPTPSPQPSASTSTAATGSTSAAGPAASSPTTDHWGQRVADPTSAGGGSGQPSSAAPASETPSTASTASAGAQLGTWGPGGTWVESKGDDFGGSEDPEDSQPAPTGDPGLALIAELRTFLAACKTQTEMQNGRPPFAQRARALCTAGDLRFDVARDGRSAGELSALLGSLWAERKSKLPV